MKNKYSIKKGIIAFFMAFVLLITSLPFCAFAADSFEKSISAFPESYKTELRKLHEKHPNWKFQALLTGIDWTTAVNAENEPNNSLVTNGSAYTDIFKSRESSDYNKTTDTYIQKDAGFVRANKLAVSYYMDPRNFLFDEAIFQFEKLSFDSTFTTKEVEGVIKGSFMADKNISYYNQSGKLIKTDEKYSEVIYEAGKKYNINPCFLASKILNEVGYKGSGSVSGKRESNPGIYNFYNIGAYDGANPIDKGLAWASSGSTYGRPWNTPRKSIIGGAQFNAETYIGKGQYTGYLQRFNVNPSATHSLFTHQYMTNLAGAASPAYSTYRSYYNNGIIDNTFVFVIPVYENMPGENNPGGTITLADAKNQTAKANITCNVRKGPSTSNESLGVMLQKGTTVQILDTVFTDISYHDTIIKYPFWCKVKFTSGSKTYTGYVNSSYLTLSSQTTVKPGSYTPLSFKTNKELEYRFISSDPSIATISGDKTIKFRKAGTVTITAYDSLCHYQTVKYKVVNTTDSTTIGSVSVFEKTESSVSVSFKKSSKYSQYEIYVTNTAGKLKKSVVSTGETKITGLDAGTDYKLYVRGVSSSSAKTYSSFSAPVSFSTKEATPVAPANVSGLTAKNKDYAGVALSWNAVKNADGYKIYTYDSQSKKYTALATVKGETTFEDISDNAIKATSYAVKAYIKYDSTTKYSSKYALVDYDPPTIKPKTVSEPSQYYASKTSVKLSWKAISGVSSYQVYQYDSTSKSYKKVLTARSNSCTISSLKSGKTYKFKIRAVISLYGKNYYGSFCSEFSAVTAPEKVTGLKLSSVKTTSYKLSWKSVSGASGYSVYRYDTSTKKYKKLKSVKTNYIVISSLKAGSSAKYKVKAYMKNGSSTYYGSISDEFTAVTVPSKPTGLNASSIKTTSFKLSWKKVSGASGYSVYRYDTSTKKYKKLKSVKTNYIVISSLKAGASAKYKVKAYKKNGSSTYYSSISDEFTAVTAPSKPTGLKASSVKTTSFKLSWKKVSGASGYIVYKYNTKTKKYESVVKTTKLYASPKSLKKNTTYKFTVKAYKKAGKLTAYSSLSSAINVRTKK